MDIRIAAYAIIIDGDQILLAHWNEHGRDGWTLPGGGVEGIEHPTEAVVREVYEETGYHATVNELLGVDTMVVPIEQRANSTSPLYALRLVYTARIIGGSIRNEVNGSSDEARWVPLNEVASLKRVSLLDTAIRLYQERPASGRI